MVVEVDLEGGTAAAQEGAALPDRVKRNGAGAFLSIKELKLDDAGFELEPASREHVRRLLAERRGNIVARFAPVGLVLGAVHMVLAKTDAGLDAVCSSAAGVAKNGLREST